MNALHHTDLVFDHLLKELEKRGRLRSTLVVFTADHGEAFGTHDQKLHGSRIYEENVHIPFILFNPVLFNGSRNDKVHALIDVAPTLAHLAGLQAPDFWQGSNLLGEQGKGRAFFISPYTDLILGTRYQQWKFIWNVDREETELYDLSSDPKELKNLADQHSAWVHQEQQMVTAWVQYVEGNYKQWTIQQGPLPPQ